MSTIDPDQLDSIRSAIVDGFEMLTAEKPELRDLFAMAAQVGLLAGGAAGNVSPLECAEQAYELADAMLKVRRR